MRKEEDTQIGILVDRARISGHFLNNYSKKVRKYYTHTDIIVRYKLKVRENVL